jgi:hypothetical protein
MFHKSLNIIYVWGVRHPYLVGVFAKKETERPRNYGFYAGHDRQCSRRIAEHNSKKSKQKRFDDVQDELMMNLAENKQNIPTITPSVSSLSSISQDLPFSDQPATNKYRSQNARPASNQAPPCLRLQRNRVWSFQLRWGLPNSKVSSLRRPSRSLEIPVLLSAMQRQAQSLCEVFIK